MISALWLLAQGLSSTSAEAAPLDDRLAAVEEKVVAWRRDFHAHPELGNREFRTQEVIAKQLRELGLEVHLDFGHTGVVAVLQGGRPGPRVALRADMDALPVTEQTEVPFKSVAEGEYGGKTVGVMHACGHDTHVAMLLGAAEVLAGMQEKLKGSVLFVFQPAEEGAPEGEEGGAALMLKQGLFDRFAPDVVFGLHVGSGLNTGVLATRPGPLMASSDSFEIRVTGRQTHGSRPWGGVDPIVTAAQIILGAQTIVSRQVNLTQAPVVLSFGIVEGGVRSNIIPDEVRLVGTIRNLDMEIRDQVHAKLVHTAETIAQSAGATATVEINSGYPVTENDPALHERMLPTLRRVAGEDRLYSIPPVLGAEDFSYYARQVPGLFVFLGVTPWDQDATTAPSNHSPLFYVDEEALPVGVRLLTELTLDYQATMR